MFFKVIFFLMIQIVDYYFKNIGFKYDELFSKEDFEESLQNFDKLTKDSTKNGGPNATKKNDNKNAILKSHTLKK